MKRPKWYKDLDEEMIKWIEEAPPTKNPESVALFFAKKKKKGKNKGK